MAADQPRIEFLEIPFGRRGGEHVAGIDVERSNKRRQLVHEGDIEVALGVLDHLGGLGHLDRRRAMDAGGDDRAVDVGDDAQRLLVLARHHFGDGFEAMVLVARIDALRRIADGEIGAAAQARRALENGHAILFHRAGIDRRFINHDVAALEHRGRRYREAPKTAADRDDAPHRSALER